jgi:hypothetical protein
MTDVLCEIDVIRRVRRFILAEGLAGYRPLDLYTDAHPTLTSDSSLAPFQRFVLDLDGMTVHPNLVCRLDDGETTLAVEAKGEQDLLRGLAQATNYRFGFHRALLAVAGAPPPALLVLAQQQHVGVLAVLPNSVEALSVPSPHMPLLRHATSIRRQFATAEALRVGFVFNMPTHYLSVAVLMRDHPTLARGEAEPRLRAGYPVLPGASREFDSVLRGAQKLGLVTVRNDTIACTTTGEAAGQLLPDLATLAAVHQVVAPSQGRVLLHERSPAAGAVLRWLLASDPVVMLVREALADLGQAAAMPTLARAALARDRVQALATFFQPTAIDAITDGRDQVRWERVEPSHYRSTTYFQYKSIMRQAGLIAPHALGAASSMQYAPKRDIWELLR